MKATSSIFSLFFVVFFLLCDSPCASEAKKLGEWKLLKKSIGISAMHMALLPNGKIITFDRTDFGPSNISLSGGRCRHDPRDHALITDCTAHSVEFDPYTRSVRPLTVLTDTWCSSGALFPDGRLVQTGGFNDGERSVRNLHPCSGCDWAEDGLGLSVRRWYSSNQLLPSGRMIVVGGREQFNYEFVPKGASSVYQLPFLRETKGSSAENNLYPFLHLLPDGNLFLFANTKSILLDYNSHRILRTYPEMPGGESRNYPSSGSSALLPLVLNSKGEATEAVVLICGGAPPNSNSMTRAGKFLPASKACGRLNVTDESPQWEMEEMPMRRVMGDMIMLPTGDVLIINGAGKGTAGWQAARDPVRNPVLYEPGIFSIRAFKVLQGSTIPRLYHSTAHLLPDGRVLVGGSNPNVGYSFDGVLYPTELSVEAFSPPYLTNGKPRPRIADMNPGPNLRYKDQCSIKFDTKTKPAAGAVYVTLVAPSFTTHSYSMNQRLLVLQVARTQHIFGPRFVVDFYAPAKEALAPPGYYLVFVVQDGVPSPGKWVHISS